jgi:hypothetical protein
VKAIDFLDFTAMWTIRAIRPADGFKVLAGFVFVSENWVGEVDGHGVSFRYDQTLALVCTYVKGIIADGIYGHRTAAAVLAYKRARNIVNHKYQTQADNIVGKMTIAAFDRELLGLPEPKVIIGRPTFSAFLSFAVTQPPVAPTTANVSAVIRGNPHVRANASDKDGLPPSVPPGQAYEVDVSVIPPLTGSDFIDLEIINTGATNGIAVIDKKKIQSTTKISVLGSSQTVPDHGGKLQIQASLNGKVLATSNGFTVCAHPRSITAHTPPAIDVDDLSGVGMIVRETLESDSGALSHLDQVEMSELVDPFHRDEPPFGGGSGVVNNSGYQAAIPPPGLSMVDRHVEPRPSRGPKGETVKLQVHMFKCKRCGAIDKPVPFSGFEVTHEVFQVGKEFKHRVTKKPLETGVRIPNTKTIIKAKGGLGTVTSALHRTGPKD